MSQTQRNALRNALNYLQVRNDTSFEELRTLVQSLGFKDQRSLLNMCSRGLRSVQLRSDEKMRVLLVRILIALAPRSLLEIEYWLSRNHGEYVDEVHFTLFCYLDELQF